MLWLHYLATHVAEALATGSARLESATLEPWWSPLLLYLLIPNAVDLLLLQLFSGLLLEATTVFPTQSLSLHGRTCKAIDLQVTAGSGRASLHSLPLWRHRTTLLIV